MTTLIAVYTSEGCVGRCDARCYNAKHPDCDCICQGRNHGKGRDRAVAHTRALAQEWIDTIVQRGELHDYTTALYEECQQTTLWSAFDG